jgi:hypothetical protein
MLWATSSGAQVVPIDPQAACPISPSTFAAMFQSGTVTLNGAVKPADSTVNLTPNCPFFVWSEQMFLWMTSPAPKSYGGGGGRIMFSPSFYTVSPASLSGGVMRRTFLPNAPGRPIRMTLRTTELGPHLLPALLSRSGHIVEVARPDPKKPVPPIVRLQNGTSVRLTDVRRGPAGALQFFAAGREVEVHKLQLPQVTHPVVKLENGRFAPIVKMASIQSAIQARKIIINGFPIFIDGAGNVIDVEPGQADDGVLISQNGSLIYYITVVNDVFAYHRTMQGAAVIPSGTAIKFPMSATDATTVKTFAAAHGHTIVDPNALAIESKSSWIEASKVANPDDYIQVEATVPTYDKSNPNVWVPNGEATVKLVMVGIHVVGSTSGQGEMVWATFEHLGNTPSAQFSYTSTTGTKTIPQNTAGTWLFTPNGSTGPFNNQTTEPHWDTTSGHLTGSPVAPVAVLRTKPWGTDGSSTSLNTQVISANAAVITQLAVGDVRARYFQVGTTWTIFGAPPSPNNQVGTNQLANSTIETFMQASTPGGSGSNCFSCHFTNTVEVSHSYSMMKPLF